jgi:CO/xanthine dehydrogenase FAD-binding subunit
VVGSVTPAPTVVEVDPEHPGESAASQVEPWGSIHASPDYLRHLVRVLVDRVVTRARAEAT